MAVVPRRNTKIERTSLTTSGGHHATKNKVGFYGHRILRGIGRNRCPQNLKDKCLGRGEKDRAYQDGLGRSPVSPSHDNSRRVAWTSSPSTNTTHRSPQ